LGPKGLSGWKCDGGDLDSREDFPYLGTEREDARGCVRDGRFLPNEATGTTEVCTVEMEEISAGRPTGLPPRKA